jgi:hypothetical protein
MCNSNQAFLWVLINAELYGLVWENVKSVKEIKCMQSTAAIFRSVCPLPATVNHTHIDTNYYDENERIKKVFSPVSLF